MKIFVNIFIILLLCIIFYFLLRNKKIENFVSSEKELETPKTFTVKYDVPKREYIIKFPPVRTLREITFIDYLFLLTNNAPINIIELHKFFYQYEISKFQQVWSGKIDNYSWHVETNSHDLDVALLQTMVDIIYDEKTKCGKELLTFDEWQLYRKHIYNIFKKRGEVFKEIDEIYPKQCGELWNDNTFAPIFNEKDVKTTTNYLQDLQLFKNSLITVDFNNIRDAKQTYVKTYADNAVKPNDWLTDKDQTLQKNRSPGLAVRQMRPFSFNCSREWYRCSGIDFTNFYRKPFEKSK